MASSAGLFLISTLGPLVEISILVRNSVRARVQTYIPVPRSTSHKRDLF